MSSDGHSADQNTVDRIAAGVLDALSADDRETRAFYIDTVVHPGGSEIGFGDRTLMTDADTVLVFVDDEPGKNWAHRCRYVLFDLDGGTIETVVAQFPPSLTDVPGTYRPLSLPPGVPGWALWFNG